MGLFDFLRRWRSLKKQPTKEQIVALNRRNPVYLQNSSPYRSPPSESFRPLKIPREEIERKNKFEMRAQERQQKRLPLGRAGIRLRENYQQMRGKRLKPLLTLNFQRGRLRK